MSQFALILLALFALVILTGLVMMIFSGAKGKAAEDLCYTFNLLRAKTGKEKLGFSINPVPNACQTLEKDELFKTNDKEKAMENLRTLMAQCWHNWLEGLPGENLIVTNKFILGSGTTGGDKCFICYTFINQVEFTKEEFLLSLEKNAYTVKDTSDMCWSQGGGVCGETCEGQFNREVDSNKCGVGQKCCVVETGIRDTCINKGGKCLESCSGLYSVPYDGWSCSRNNCCIKPSNFFNYLDYIQRFGGPGMVIVGNDKFEKGKIYAVVFNEQKDLGGYGWNAEMDGILIDELNNVQKKCAISSGVVS